jgi:hypothetical protein
MFNHDLSAFYEKIIRDMRHAQTDEGLVPSIAPEYAVFDGGFRDSPEWGNALILDPWRHYQMYGDSSSSRLDPVAFPLQACRPYDERPRLRLSGISLRAW